MDTLCFICGGPVPLFACVLWCDSCIDEYNASGMSLEDFIASKKRDADAS